MIVFNRSAGIAPGKTVQALGFAQEITAYMKDAYGVQLDVLLPIGGNPQRIAWATRYQDLAAYEAVSVKLLGDKRYWDIVSKSSDNFVAGSMNDTLWRSV